MYNDILFIKKPLLGVDGYEDSIFSSQFAGRKGRRLSLRPLRPATCELRTKQERSQYYP